MSAVLAAHVQDYLRLRRALGFKLNFEGQVLPQFVAYLDAAGLETVTVEAAVAWTRLSVGAQPVTLSHRLGAVRGFARYLATIDPATQIPPTGLFGKQQRRTPYIYSPQEIGRLLAAAGRLRPPLRAATYETLLGLLAVSGMRIGEARRLLRGDVDLTEGVIRIRHTKFDRDRLVPLHPSATKALRGYAARRDRLCPQPRTESFFIASVGTGLAHSSVHATFSSLLDSAGLPTAAGDRPRIHDLRHSLVVNTLIDWQRDGTDIAARLPVLSTYLGHISPASTYWYFSAVPELMQLAAAGLERRSGSRS
ncbi:MAG: tyrosine-type recombinase/integrase [Pseudonocardia sp.]|nr:tyrosine-type recombinase/integrase [Pseudonocardia sp.]